MAKTKGRTYIQTREAKNIECTPPLVFVVYTSSQQIHRDIARRQSNRFVVFRFLCVVSPRLFYFCALYFAVIYTRSLARGGNRHVLTNEGFLTFNLNPNPMTSGTEQLGHSGLVSTLVVISNVSVNCCQSIVHGCYTK